MSDPVLPRLLEAKRLSDQGDYQAKLRILQRELEKNPTAWYIDQMLKRSHPGITHAPTGFRFHLPKKAIPANIRISKSAIEKAASLVLSLMHPKY